MKPVVKTLLYVAFVLLAVISLQRVRQESARPSANDRRLASVEDARERESTAAAEASGGTNAVAEVATKADASGVTNGVAGGASTNLAAAAAAGSAGGATPKPAAAQPGSGRSRLATWIGAFVVGLVGIAGLVGWDLTQWFATRTNRALGIEVDTPGVKAPEYDAAEQEWAKGNHLDAISMMREYLAENPSEQYVALRIAEIYEKDLGNYLAAALEYEEVLNQKLPREKWGWTALRLSNLYSGRLNQQDKAMATLERVMRDYPETAAAKKARERLGVPEPTQAPDAAPGASEAAAAESAPAEASGLPTGFRRKKP